MYICLYVYMYTCSRPKPQVLFKDTLSSALACDCACACALMCVWVCVCVCVCVCMCVCVGVVCDVSVRTLRLPQEYNC